MEKKKEALFVLAGIALGGSSAWNRFSCSLFSAGLKLQEMNATHAAPGAFILDVLFLKE